MTIRRAITALFTALVLIGGGSLTACGSPGEADHTEDTVNDDQNDEENDDQDDEDD
jgi:predicted small lipoprotein YifL